MSQLGHSMHDLSSRTRIGHPIQQEGWTCPNVRVCKTFLDFGLHAVEQSGFRIPKFAGFRNPNPLNGASELIRIPLPKVNGNKRDKREITIEGLNFPWHRHWHPSIRNIFELSKYCNESVVWHNKMLFKGNWVLRIFWVRSVVQYPIFIQNSQCGASENVAKNCRKEEKSTEAKTRKSKLWAKHF